MTEPTHDWSIYVDQAAQGIGLPLAPEHCPGVIDNFTRIAAIAQLVMEVSLPPDLEAAPTFQPSPHSPQ